MITQGDLAIFFVAIIIIMIDRDRRLRMESERKGSYREWFEERRVVISIVCMVGVVIGIMIIMWGLNTISAVGNLR